MLVYLSKRGGIRSLKTNTIAIILSSPVWTQIASIVYNIILFFSC